MQLLVRIQMSRSTQQAVAPHGGRGVLVVIFVFVAVLIVFVVSSALVGIAAAVSVPLICIVVLVVVSLVSLSLLSYLSPSRFPSSSSCMGCCFPSLFHPTSSCSQWWFGQECRLGRSLFPVVPWCLRFVLSPIALFVPGSFPSSVLLVFPAARSFPPSLVTLIPHPLVPPIHPASSCSQRWWLVLVCGGCLVAVPPLHCRSPFPPRKQRRLGLLRSWGW
jgi:hypothetical protein